MKYIIKKIEEDFAPDANPNKNIWEKANKVYVDKYVWSKEETSAFPYTEVRILYSNKRIYVLFSVKESFIRGTLFNLNDPVCTDSCVEFFIAPNKQGYFNFEINCIGTLLLYYGKDRYNRIPVKEEFIKDIHIATSLPKGKHIEMENKENIFWYVEYSFTFELTSYYANVLPPHSGTIWYGNFYKCGDKTPFPHWGMWNPIHTPEPDFHRPEFFGELIFE